MDLDFIAEIGVTLEAIGTDLLFFQSNAQIRYLVHFHVHELCNNLIHSFHHSIVPSFHRPLIRQHNLLAITSLNFFSILLSRFKRTSKRAEN